MLILAYLIFFSLSQKNVISSSFLSNILVFHMLLNKNHQTNQYFYCVLSLSYFCLVPLDLQHTDPDFLFLSFNDVICSQYNLSNYQRYFCRNMFSMFLTPFIICPNISPVLNANADTCTVEPR